MHQSDAHIMPVFYSFIGMLISAVINMANMCCHHDRPFQLLSTKSVRLGIVLPILSPFVVVGQALLYVLLSQARTPWLRAASTRDMALMAIPIAPLLLSAVAAAVNMALTAPAKRSQLIHPFARRVNTDEEMLLQTRCEGVPEVAIGDVFSERQARKMIDTHYNGLFWSEFACLVIDFLFAVPWLAHLISG
jgi:hypothetical protein